MSIIENFNLIKGYLTPVQKEKLEKHALFFDERSSINFKILEVSNNVVKVSITQGNTIGTYKTGHRELERMAKSLFEFYMPDMVIHISSSAYLEPKGITISPEWIQARMKAKGITIEQIVEETRLSKTTINDWINETKSMSKLAKAMFWYMLK